MSTISLSKSGKTYRAHLQTEERRIRDARVVRLDNPEEALTSSVDQPGQLSPVGEKPLTSLQKFQKRALTFGATKVEFMPSTAFDQAVSEPDLRAAILGPMPGAAERKRRRTKPPTGLPPYLGSLYEVPLLDREQEGHLFRKMNFLKFLANKVRDECPRNRVSARVIDEFEFLLAEALEVKNEIIRANLRLVVGLAKIRVAQGGPSLFELVSDGNMSLIRAVEKFDYERGNKFSTYASWAIIKNFARTIPEERYRAQRTHNDCDGLLEGTPDERTNEWEDESSLVGNKKTAQNLVSRLDTRERRIIVARFGLDGQELTLEQLGWELGITKERVRQIQTKAEDKLRRYALEEHLSLA